MTLQHRSTSPTLRIIGVASTLFLLTACTPSTPSSKEAKPATPAPVQQPTQPQLPSTDDPITSSFLDKLIINAEQGRIIEPFQAQLGANKQEIQSVFGKPQAPSSHEDYYSYELETHQTSFSFKQDKVSSITYRWKQDAPISYQDVISKLGRPNRIIQGKGIIDLIYTIKDSTVTFVFPMHKDQDTQKLMKYTISTAS